MNVNMDGSVKVRQSQVYSLGIESIWRWHIKVYIF